MADVAAPAAPTATPSPTPSAPAPAEAKTTTPAAPKAEPKAPEKRKYTLKVDGKEETLEVGEEDLPIYLQKGRAADKRMSEAAEVRKQFRDFVELFKRDPFAAAKDPVFGGMDLDKLAEQRLLERYQLEVMSPEQRAQKERELEIERYKKEAAEAKAEIQRRAEAELHQRAFQETEAKFLQALGEAGVEKSYDALYEMARLADLALENGIEYTPKQLANLVQQSLDDRRTKLTNAVSKGLKGDRLLQSLGDEVVQEVLRASIAKVRGQSAMPEEPEPEGEHEPKLAPERPKEPLRRAQTLQARAKNKSNYSDFWKRMRR